MNAKSPVINEELQSGPIMFFKSGYKIKRVFINDIVLIQACKDYSKMILKNDEKSQGLIIHGCLKQTLKRFDERFGKEFIIRVHLQYAVQRNLIEEVEGNFISIRGEKVPIGSVYKQELKKALLLV